MHCPELLLLKEGLHDPLRDKDLRNLFHGFKMIVVMAESQRSRLATTIYYEKAINFAIKG